MLFSQNLSERLALDNMHYILTQGPIIPPCHTVEVGLDGAVNSFLIPCKSQKDLNSAEVYSPLLSILRNFNFIPFREDFHALNASLCFFKSTHIFLEGSSIKEIK